MSPVIFHKSSLKKAGRRLGLRPLLPFFRNWRGFTLVEIMVVVAVLSVLAAIVIPNFISYRKTSHATACRENMVLIEKACQASLLRTGKVETDLDKLSDASSSVSFLKGKPKCPIGGSYIINYDLEIGEFKVTCSKADNEEHKVEE